MKEVLKNYSGILLLLVGITVGSIIGIVAPQIVEYIKPLGDIFLNLLFVSVVPLVFFAVSNSIASLEQESKFGKILLIMSFTFLFFILTAAVFHHWCSLPFSGFIDIGKYRIDCRSHQRRKLG